MNHERVFECFTGTDGFRLIELSTVMGKPLIFTKIEIGKGINTDGGGRTSLIEKTMECDITRVAEVENADVDEARTASILPIPMKK